MPELETIFNDLVRLQIELWNAVDARLRLDHDLPLGSFEALRIISAHDACRVFDIADELVITVGGASKLIDRIEARGLCARRSNPGDRRSSILELTAEGTRLQAAAAVTLDAELSARLAVPLGAPQLAAFAMTLATLRAAEVR